MAISLDPKQVVSFDELLMSQVVHTEARTRLRRVQFAVWVALIIIVLTSGCVAGSKVRAYSGDKLQKSEVAVIKGWCLFELVGYECIDVYEIDGISTKATKVEVLPGWHELIIRRYAFNIGLLGTPAERELVGFNFEAGHEYKIKYHFEGILIAGIDIVDVTTGALILTKSWSTPGESR